MTAFIRKVGNNFYVRYANGTAWVRSSEQQVQSLCASCCPIQFLSSWEDPNAICNDLRFTHPINLKYPYYIFKGQPNNGVITSTPKSAPSSAYSLFCGTPPTTNFTSRISIKIPDDPVFSGKYVFDYKPVTQTWALNTNIGMTDTAVSGYQDTYSSYANKKIISLVETTNEPAYKGYVEYATSGAVGSNLSGVYAFPCQFVFTAIQAPQDINGIDWGLNATKLPLGTGHRAVIGFNPPLRWRHPYGDWTVVDQIGHNILPENYPLDVLGTAPAKPWFNTNYFTGIASQPSSINISGISNNPYNLSSSSSKTPVCTGLSTIGFSYRTSGVGVPFDSSAYNNNSGVFMLSRCSGTRPHFHKYTFVDLGNTYSIDETALFSPKQYLDAAIEFNFSCRTSGTTCLEFNSLTPVSTGYSTISNNCFGSYVNADFMCGDNLAHPSGGYFTTEGVQDIKIVYSGIPYQVASIPHVYPMVKATDSTGNVYKANSGQMIFVDYNGAITPDALRSWINSNFNFVTLDNSDNVTIKWPGTDVYWKIRDDAIVVSGLNPDTFGFNGTYYEANVLDSNSNKFYSKDGGNSNPRIFWATNNSVWAISNNGSSQTYKLNTVSYPSAPIGSWINGDSVLPSSMTTYSNKTAWARITPEGGEGSNVGVYVFKSTLAYFIAQYAYDSDNNQYVNLDDSNIQMRFSVDQWQLGRVVNSRGDWNDSAVYNKYDIVRYDGYSYFCNEPNINAIPSELNSVFWSAWALGSGFIPYYRLTNVTCGNPLLLDPQIVDYSDYNPVNTYGTVQIPVTCLSQPIGQWVSVRAGVPGSAISVRDPLAGGSTGSVTC
jgi:hypothetical protein